MTDRKKVIKGFTCCDGAAVYLGHCQDDCPYLSENDQACECVEKLHSDALSLLKAQEPRVMTLEEIKAWACKTESQKDAVYIQNFNDPEFVWAYLGKFESDSGISRFDGYGYSWRCWTSRPTEEQMEDVKWDENKGDYNPSMA